MFLFKRKVDCIAEAKISQESQADVILFWHEVPPKTAKVKTGVPIESKQVLPGGGSSTGTQVEICLIFSLLQLYKYFLLSWKY